MTGATASLEAAVATARELGRAVSPGTERVALIDACGRTVADPIVARHALPGFDSSAMDGFAVRAADLAGTTPAEPVRLTIVAESRAGVPAPAAVQAGQAVRIATGAVVPLGADAVVPYEVVQQDGDCVLIAAPVAVGQFVRPAGADVAVGETLVRAGTVLRPQQLAPLAGLGFRSIAVRRKPRVSVLFTGDEVVRGAGPDDRLEPGAVHDVNGVLMPVLLRSWGAEVAEVVHVPDDRAATRAALAAATGDLVVVCGGLSMGPHDHVRPALEALGARQDLFRIALQPGKPTWMGALTGEHGTAAGDRPVFGLPGNPVSVFVTATLLVRAAIVEARGEPPAVPKRARLSRAARARPDRLAAYRASLRIDDHGQLTADVLDGQASHLLGSLSRADGLALVPPGTDLVAGAVVDVVSLDSASFPGDAPYDRDRS